MTVERVVQTDPRNDMLKVGIFSDVGKQHKNAGQALLAGIEEMVHQNPLRLIAS